MMKYRTLQQSLGQLYNSQHLSKPYAQPICDLWMSGVLCIFRRTNDILPQNCPLWCVLIDYNFWTILEIIWHIIADHTYRWTSVQLEEFDKLDINVLKFLVHKALVNQHFLDRETFSHDAITPQHRHAREILTLNEKHSTQIMQIFAM